MNIVVFTKALQYGYAPWSTVKNNIELLCAASHAEPEKHLIVHMFVLCWRIVLNQFIDVPGETNICYSFPFILNRFMDVTSETNICYSFPTLNV